MCVCVQMLAGSPLVLCSLDGSFNLAHHVTVEAMEEVEVAATQTLATLRAEEGDAFGAVFLNKADFANKFDCHVR